jgi:hypothetical protein
MENKAKLEEEQSTLCWVTASEEAFEQKAESYE